MKLLSKLRKSAPTVPETRESSMREYGDPRRLLLYQFIRRNYPNLSEDSVQVVVEAAERAHEGLVHFSQYSRQRWLVDYLERGTSLREIQDREPHFILPEEVLVEAESGKRAYVPPRFEKHENIRDITFNAPAFQCSVTVDDQHSWNGKGWGHCISNGRGH